MQFVRASGIMASLRVWVVIAACIALSSAQANPGSQASDYYVSRFSDEPVTDFPGGSYKESTTLTFPASTAISGAIFMLKPGGLRELHWHYPNEWGYVISGTCRGTFVDQGKEHPVDSWDFSEGDIWYFPANLGHAVLGLGPSGCTFLTGYDDGAFSELRAALDLSAWLRSLPPAIAAQTFGVEEKLVKEHLGSVKDTFLPRGDLEALTRGQTDPPPLLVGGRGSLQPPQAAQLVHRYPLNNSIPKVDTAGGFIKVVDSSVLPASVAMSGALVRMLPGALRAPHWHLHSEWQYVINGTVRVGSFNGSDQVTEGMIREGDVGFAPAGIGHWILNEGEEDAWIVLIFNSGTFTDIEVGFFTGAFPSEYIAVSLDTSPKFSQMLRYGLGGLVGGKSGGRRGTGTQ